MKKIMVLGATGYLGWNIVRRLSDDAYYDITCVVRKTSDISRLRKLHVNIISNDLSEIEIFLKCNSVDYVINGVCTYKSNDTLYEELLASNMIFPLSILNLAVKYGVANFITMGTSLPQNTNIYSFSKSKFSEFGSFLSKSDGINFGDLKLEMFYGGEYEPSDRFISSCKQKLKNNQELKLTEGFQKRDLIRVEDIVNIIALIIETNILNGYMCLPIGSGEQHSIREIIEFMRDEIKSKSILNWGTVPSRISEPNTLADIKWYRELNYTLKYSFWDGLRKECMD